MPDGQFDSEVNNLIEWCEDLDFEKYQDNWFTLATSAKVDTPGEDTAVQVYESGMGDITIGLASGREGIERSQLSSEFGDPNSISAVDPVRANKFKEDLFQKSNLEYEHKLKEHLYQFENRANETGLDGENIHGDAGTMMQMSQPKNYSEEDNSSPGKN